MTVTHVLLIINLFWITTNICSIYSLATSDEDISEECNFPISQLTGIIGSFSLIGVVFLMCKKDDLFQENQQVQQKCIDHVFSFLFIVGVIIMALAVSFTIIALAGSDCPHNTYAKLVITYISLSAFFTVIIIIISCYDIRFINHF